jgi:hypothetical protein
MESHESEFEAWTASGEQGGPVTEPSPAPSWENLYDSGSMVGLGIQMRDHDGSAFLIKHEGRSWLANLLTGGCAGSMDDLNALAEHAFYKNAPSNKESRFRVENPHLVAIILTHMEEIVPLLQQAREGSKDSVAGLQRFL